LNSGQLESKEPAPCTVCASCAPSPSPSPVSFEGVAKQFSPVTDKVSLHNYAPAYDAFLPKYFNRPKVKLLEIGLGCGMPYGPGASIPVWREYFKGRVDIHVFEFDRTCGQKWEREKGSDVTMHYGDQANVEDLKPLFGENFDIIIDDGGHAWAQQIISFQQLFPSALSSKGVYFLEDLLTSYMSGYAAGPQTAVNYIKNLHDDLNKGSAPGNLKHSEAADLRSISCWDEICVFEKS